MDIDLTPYRDFLLHCGLAQDRADRLHELEAFRHSLRQANARMNLTRIVGAEDFWNLHICDSLLLGGGVPDMLAAARSVADVGCGAGFPAIPLAWANPRLAVTGIESRRGKAEFVAGQAAKMGLTNLRVETTQAREAARDATHAGHYDLVTLRAVGEPGKYIRHVRGLLRDAPTSRIVFYKTPAAVEAELSAARREAAKYGLSVRLSQTLRLPRGEERQFLIVRAD